MNNINSKKIELLAPAGGYESFIAAINAGADAVYMGLKNFNARVMTSNFELHEYKEAIDYAHKRNVKVYLTLNTLLLDDEIRQALADVYALYEFGLDGVIVQDLGIVHLIHKIMPDLSLHASTQMSICTLEQVKILEKIGFERVVLARELSIDEIKEIAQNTNLEIEVFVHGALCVSVSGQCLMSAIIGNRSANRGSCAGPCRKKYSLYNLENKCIQKNKYLLSKKDIFGLDKIDRLIEAGVHSLKIEGRNKIPEYVAGVVKNYRNAIDYGYAKSQDKQVLQLFNRSGKSDGYLNGVRYRESISENSPKNTGLLLGKVLAVKKEYIKVQLKEDIDLHDGIEVQDGLASTVVTCVRDKDFNVVNRKVNKGNAVWLGDIRNVKIGQDIYKTSSNSLNQEYKKYAENNIKKIEYDIKVLVKNGEKIKASCGEILVETQYIPEKSQTSGLKSEKVIETFSKTENTALRFNVSTDIAEGLFVPVSKLNDLRNELVNKIEQSKVIRRKIDNVNANINQLLVVENNIVNTVTKRKVNSLFVYKYNENEDYISYYKKTFGNKPDILYINAIDFKRHEQDILKYLDKCKIYFVIPNVIFKNLTKYIKDNIERLLSLGVSGILLGNIGYVGICQKLKQKYKTEIVADYSLNITNKYTAEVLKQFGVDVITPLLENCLPLDSLYDQFETEQVCDLVTAMTTRYCVISSFVIGSKTRQDCKFECVKQNYYLLDEQNKRYYLVTDNLDCITKIVTDFNNKENKTNRTRRCIM